MKEKIKALNKYAKRSKHAIFYEIVGEYLTAVINDKYRIYDDGVIYNIYNGRDIPLYVFKIRDDLLKIID